MYVRPKPTLMCYRSHVFLYAAAESPEEVAAYLVPRVRAVLSTPPNPLTGALQTSYIRFLTQQKALKQIALVGDNSICKEGPMIILIVHASIYACMQSLVQYLLVKRRYYFTLASDVQ